MTDEVKYCKDCKYCVVVEEPFKLNYFCSHPKLKSLVTGETILTCEEARESKCGESGGFFEKKE